LRYLHPRQTAKTTTKVHTPIFKIFIRFSFSASAVLDYL